METLFHWLGFIGAWLLFAGPIYQATLELKDEDIEVDRIRAAGSKITALPKVSAWWWIVPPIRFYKELQRGKQTRLQIMKVLSREDVEAMISFNSKAMAWLFVAAGGFCIAGKETYELAAYSDWNNVVLIIVIFAMFALSIFNVVYRLRRAEAIKNPY